MQAATSAIVGVHPIDAGLGAEIRGVDLSKPLDRRTGAAILDAWHRHSALIIRNQSLTDPQLIAFSRLFGELEMAPPNKSGSHWIEGYPELACISNITVNGEPVGSLGNGEAIWHTDMSFMAEPPAASLLYSLEIPRRGGATHLANMYKAYETLPGDLKRRVENRVAVHDATYTSAGEVRKKFAAFVGTTDPERAPGARHPLVRVHPATGRKALYLGRRSGASGILGETDSQLWDALWAHCGNPALTWAHEWAVGDLLIWDNRCTMHYREAFDDAERRMMHRTQTKGDAPVAA
ncbi:MAG: TauD/TfdA family dioxygenase [Alphaproteobacteria bacterium]|nr:TauD/TfdA family dioxygenase [Alphaproteobacteria bacterium]